jgi:phosphoribosylformylglycinamidine cyclo-ligase
MPSVYARGEFDLAGFAVGAVDRGKIVDGGSVRPGDLLVGLFSSGLHSNGYSLARKVVFEILGKRIGQRVPEWGATVAEELLRPTRIYVRPVLSLLRKGTILGMAHITGGGITGNVPRSLPDGLSAVVDRSTWEIPPVFRTICAAARLPDGEAFRTFNMGIGMVLMLRARDADRAVAHFRRAGIPAAVIGEIRRGRHRKPDVIFAGGGR